MERDIMDMTDMDKYNTEENRSGIRKLYSRYAAGSPVPSDAAARFIIRSFAMEDMYHYYMLEACLQAFDKDPGNRELLMLTVACLKHSKLFYYDEPEGDYPSFTCQPDPKTGEMTYLLYSYRRRAPREYRKIYQYHYAGFPEIKDVITACGCKKIALYEVKNVVLDVAEVFSCMDSMDSACASFDRILQEGISGDDLFEFAVSRFNGQEVACTLRDGTEIAGTSDNIRYAEGYDMFVTDFRAGMFCMVVEGCHDDSPEDISFKEYDGEDYLELTDEIREKYVYKEDVLWDRSYILADGKLYSNELVYDPRTKSVVYEYIMQDYLDYLEDIERVTLRTEDIACVRLCPPAQKDAEE